MGGVVGGVVCGVVKIAGNKSVILAGNRSAAGDWGIKQTLRASSWVVIGGWGNDFAIFACYICYKR